MTHSAQQQLVEDVQQQLRPELVAQRAVFVQQIPLGDTTLGLIPLQRSELAQQQHQSPEIIVAAHHPHPHQLPQNIDQPTTATVQIIQHHVPHNIVPIVTRPAEIIHQQQHVVAENVVARSEVVLQGIGRENVQQQQQPQQSAEFLAENQQPEVIVSQEEGIIISQHQHQQETGMSVVC